MTIGMLALILLAQQEPIPGQRPRTVIGIQHYNLLARQARRTGDVRLKCIISPKGKVSEIFLMEGDPLLAKDAIENARQWEFESTTPDANEVVLTYRFRLIGTGTRKPPKTEFRLDLPNIVTVTSEVPCIDHAPCNEDEIGRSRTPVVRPEP